MTKSMCVRMGFYLECLEKWELYDKKPPGKLLNRVQVWSSLEELFLTIKIKLENRIAVTHSEEETAIKIKNPDTSRREAD